MSVISRSRWHFAHSVRSRGEDPGAFGTVTPMGRRHRWHVGRTFVVTVAIVPPSREEKAQDGVGPHLARPRPLGIVPPRTEEPLTDDDRRSGRGDSGQILSGADPWRPADFPALQQTFALARLAPEVQT